MNDSQEEKQDNTIKDYAEMVSGLGTGYGLLKSIPRSAPAPTMPTQFVGPAVGLPVPNGP